MATYIISYDLNRPGQDYASLREAIKRAGTWWHHLDSTWIVLTNKTAKQVRDALTPEIDANDKIFVIRSGGEGAWAGFNDKGSQWLKDNI
jgi:hypothetical protein